MKKEDKLKGINNGVKVIEEGDIFPVELKLSNRIQKAEDEFKKRGIKIKTNKDGSIDLRSILKPIDESQLISDMNQKAIVATNSNGEYFVNKGTTITCVSGQKILNNEVFVKYDSFAGVSRVYIMKSDGTMSNEQYILDSSKYNLKAYKNYKFSTDSYSHRVRRKTYLHTADGQKYGWIDEKDRVQTHTGIAGRTMPYLMDIHGYVLNFGTKDVKQYNFNGWVDTGIRTATGLKNITVYCNL